MEAPEMALTVQEPSSGERTFNFFPPRVCYINDTVAPGASSTNHLHSIRYNGEFRATTDAAPGLYPLLFRTFIILYIL